MSLRPGRGAERLRTAVRELFRPATSTGSAVGLEVEVVPVDATSGRRVTPRAGESTGIDATLRRLAVHGNWTPGPEQGRGIVPWSLPDGGRLSWEPGGQLEYASPPCASPLKAAGLAAEVVRRVASAAAEDGVRLLARGMDPATRVQDTRLLLDRPRYRRMTAHYRRRGPEGERMMRLTAGIHLNVDLGPDPMARFRAANRLVPLLGAIFANSPRRQDADEAWRSHRSEQWRRLDPSRSGVVDGEDPEACYAEFAAGADAFLLGADDRPAIPFAEHLDSASPSELAEHLTTLFPEVRPRGYLEIRVVDALPADLYPVVTAFTVGLLFDRDSTQALMRGPGASADRLERAGREGVRDPELRAEALEALGRAARTWERQGTPVGERAARDLRRFAEGFTARGLDPGDAAATCVDDPIVTPSGAPSAA